MGKPFRFAILSVLFLTFAGINRGCNLFSSLSSKDSITAKVEDVRVAVAQGAWIDACVIAKEFQDAGDPLYPELRLRIADGMMTSVFSDPDFFACVIGGDCDGTDPVCVMNELNTNDACTNASCQSVLNECVDLLGQSSYSSLSSSIPGLACTSAFLQCTNLQQYQGQTSVSDAAKEDLISCKRALYAVRASCPQFESTFVGGPCNTTLNLPGSPCNADICNVNASGVCQDVTGGPPDVLNSNYYLDATFLFMSNQTVSCD